MGEDATGHPRQSAGDRRTLVLRGEDTPANDIDLLVEFEAGRTPGLLGMAEMGLELVPSLAGGRAADV